MSKTSEEIKKFAAQFDMAISLRDFKIGGFSRAEVERAVRDGILVWRTDGKLELV
jgi:hypothetical protein